MRLINALVLFLCISAWSGIPAHAEVLLFDTFNTSANSFDTNFEVTTRQTGTLAPITYTDGGEPIFSQVNNPGIPNTLLMAGRSFGTSGIISLDHNFNATPGLNHAFVIEFDVNPVLLDPTINMTQTSWISINFGTSFATRNQLPQQNEGIGMIFRGNGMSGVADAGVGLGEHPFAAGADDLFHHIRIEIADSTDGNPFDGNGSPATIRVFADGSATPFNQFTRALGFTSNYITIFGEGEGSGGDGVVRHALDNLALSIAPVPEPSTSDLLGTAATILLAMTWQRRKRLSASRLATA